MAGKKGKRSLLEQLRTVPDPRSRHGRVYPLDGMLAVLILAAMHGENSLLGMWPWAKAREQRLENYMPLGLWARPHLPSLATFWQVLQKRDAGVLERVAREGC
ncbi:MAG TPA: transposase family protein [Anaerolineae bacterium]|nr:transposase family protein [Anaerolineae bacterium]